jgi:hypothetical protein
LLSGCVELEQKTKLNEDGSGTMSIHYWTKTSNIIGEELAGFGFTEDKVNVNYASSNTEVSEVKIEKNLEDSTTHVNLNLKFTNINKITDAKAFSKVKATWEKHQDGMLFQYILIKDTSNANKFGMSNYKLLFEFEFPNDIVRTNGRMEDNTAYWEKTIADLNEDVEMTAIVKEGGKGCGLFGVELPIVILLGFTILIFNKKNSSK